MSYGLVKLSGMDFGRTMINGAQVYGVAAWLDPDRLARMSATFDATPGSMLERITVAVASEVGNIELPEPLDVPDGWEQLRRAELEPYARATGRFVRSNASRDELVGAIRAALAHRVRVEAVVRCVGELRRPPEAG